MHSSGGKDSQKKPTKEQFVSTKTESHAAIHLWPFKKGVHRRRSAYISLCGQCKLNGFQSELLVQPENHSVAITHIGCGGCADGAEPQPCARKWMDVLFICCAYCGYAQIPIFTPSLKCYRLTKICADKSACTANGNPIAWLCVPVAIGYGERWCARFGREW